MSKNSGLFRRCIPKYLMLLFWLPGVISCKKSVDSMVDPLQPAAGAPASLTVKNYSLPHSNAYYEYLPSGYSSGSSEKYPLLLFFHGAGESGNGSTEINRLLIHGPLKLVQNKSFPAAFTSNGQSFKFIILAVQFTMYGIYPAEIETFIEYAKQQYRVDVSRIYLTGLSMGGAECWNYVASSKAHAEKIAAMVPVAAYIDDQPEDHRIDAAKAQVIASANLPIWSTHNSGDPTSKLAWVTTAQKLLLQADPPMNPAPKLTVFNSNSHEAWSQTYSPEYRENNMNVYEWMLQYHR